MVVRPTPSDGVEHQPEEGGAVQRQRLDAEAGVVLRYSLRRGGLGGFVQAEERGKDAARLRALRVALERLPH